MILPEITRDSKTRVWRVFSPYYRRAGFRFAPARTVRKSRVYFLILLFACVRPAFAQGTGPIAAYSFNDNSGTTAADASGNGRDAAISGATWTAAGRFNGALAFDGVDDWVTVPEDPALNLTTGMTVEAWVYPTALSGYRSVVLREVPGGLAYGLYANDDAPRPAIWIKADGTDVEAAWTSPLSLDNWAHLAATYDGTTLRLFLNGTPVGSYAVSTTLSDASGVLRFGGNAVWGEYFSGRLDEIRIYDRALSVAEILTDVSTAIPALPGSDTTPPSVSLTAPAAGTVSGTITIKASASDDVGVVGVQFKVNGSLFGSEDLDPPFEIDWGTGGLFNGTYRLSAVARDAAGNKTESALVEVNVFNPSDPSLVGVWTAPIQLGATAFNTVVLSTGRVLLYAGQDSGGSSGVLYNPATGPFRSVPTSDNLYGAAQSQLNDGRILVVGGYDSADGPGADFANIFDPVTQTWQAGIARMAQRRWHPTTTTLGDGRVLVTSGATTCVTCIADVPEIYNPATNQWTQMAGASLSQPYNPFMFLLPDGRVLSAGASDAPDVTRALDVNAQTWTTIDGQVLDAGSAAMFRLGKIMKSGSSAGGTDFGPAAATTYVLDANAASPAWRQTAPMAFPRAFHNLVLLPDGNVLAVGGAQHRDGSDPSQAVLAAEIWSPTTESWTTVASMFRPRLRNSTAVLLPDATVLVAGSGDFGPGVDDTTAEIYYPPYFFKGPRPGVPSAGPNITYGSTFPVGASGGSGMPIRSIALVRLGATTHQIDMDQRYLELSFFPGEGGLIATAPASIHQAPPGYYMLFLVNTAGVPSLATIVRLLSPFDETPPTAPTALTASVTGITVNLQWTGSVDDTAVARYSIHRSTTPGFVPAPGNWRAWTTDTTYSDIGLGNGTYYYVVTAHDLNGNISSPSNQASGTVSRDDFAPVVNITSPRSFATVSGWTTLVAVATDDVGVTNVEFMIDGSVVGSDNSHPYAMLWWDSASVSNGTHIVTARAFDATGKSNVSPQVAVIASNGTVIGGLVAAYNFNQTSTTTVVDVSGTGNTGTISGAAWTTLGRYNGGYSFDGVNDRINIADSATLDLTGAFTLEAWVYPTATNDWRTVILKEQPNGLAYALYAREDAARPSGWVNTAGTDHFVAGTAGLVTNTWSHLVTTFDGSALRLYVSGVLVQTSAHSGTASVSSGALRIGGNAIWGEYFRGRIDEVRIYNRALSPAEIQVNMGTPVP